MLLVGRWARVGEVVCGVKKCALVWRMRVRDGRAPKTRREGFPAPLQCDFYMLKLSFLVIEHSLPLQEISQRSAACHVKWA